MNILFQLAEKPEFLTSSEVEELTGRQFPTSQIKWLKENEWQFAVNATGRPVIARLYSQAKLCGIDPKTFFQPQKSGWEPDVEAFRKKYPPKNNRKKFAA